MNFKTPIPVRLFVKKISQVPNPIIVYWDTCVLLDLLRLHSKNNLGISIYEKYEKIAQMICNKQVVSITSSFVPVEFNAHYDALYQNFQNEQKNRIKNICDWIEPLGEDDMINKIKSKDTCTKFINIITQICENTYVINESAATKRAAYSRDHARMAPAERKSEYNDCCIWLTYIDTIQNINNNNINNKYNTFITTNTEDYMEDVSTNKIYKQINDDIQMVDGQILFSINKLYGDLKGLGL